jgi:hypothetical protein
MARQSGFLHENRNPAAEDVWIEGASIAGEEEVRLLAVSTKKWSCRFEVGTNPGDGPPTHRDDPILLPLAKPDMDRAMIGIEVLEFQIAEFCTSQPVGIKEFQDCSVTDAEWIGDVWYGKEASDLSDCQGDARKTLLGPRKDQIACRIIGNDALAIHPTEPIPEGRDPLSLCAPAEGPPPDGMPIAPEPYLICLKNGLSDLTGGCQIACSTPIDKCLQGISTALNSPGRVVVSPELLQIGVME